MEKKAFNKCYCLTRIKLSNSITKINDSNQFEKCNSLKNILILDPEIKFYNCKNLNTIATRNNKVFNKLSNITIIKF